MHEGCAAEYIILIGSQIPVGNLPVAIATETNLKSCMFMKFVFVYFNALNLFVYASLQKSDKDRSV